MKVWIKLHTNAHQAKTWLRAWFKLIILTSCLLNSSLHWGSSVPKNKFSRGRLKIDFLGQNMFDRSHEMHYPLWPIFGNLMTRNIKHTKRNPLGCKWFKKYTKIISIIWNFGPPRDPKNPSWGRISLLKWLEKAEIGPNAPHVIYLTCFHPKRSILRRFVENLSF